MRAAAGGSSSTVARITQLRSLDQCAQPVYAARVLGCIDFDRR
jgi:hypothetical protein